SYRSSLVESLPRNDNCSGNSVTSKNSNRRRRRPENEPVQFRSPLGEADCCCDRPPSSENSTRTSDRRHPSHAGSATKKAHGTSCRVAPRKSGRTPLPDTRGLRPCSHIPEVASLGFSAVPRARKL